MRLDKETTSRRNRGIVISFLPRKGYGFIRDENNEQLFIHFSDIKGEGYKVLEVGEEVEYTRVESERGAQAKDVIRLAPPTLIDVEINPNEGHRKW
jgi:CspA family cold shock protein